MGRGRPPPRPPPRPRNAVALGQSSTPRENDEWLADLYHNLASPAGYSSAAQLYKTARERDPSITFARVKRFLSTDEPYAQFCPPHRQPPGPLPPQLRIVTTVPGELVFVDILILGTWSRWNEGHVGIFVAVDHFSKYMLLYPMKSKSTDSILAALEDLVRRWPGRDVGARIQALSSDHEPALFSRAVGEWLKRKRIRLIEATSEAKAASAEAKNRSLRRKLVRHWVETNTRRWLDLLPLLEKQSNNEPKESIGGRSPASIFVDPDANWTAFLKNVAAMRENALPYTSAADKLPALRVGSLVRVSKPQRYRWKEADPSGSNWSAELFEVARIDTKRRIKMYQLKSLQGSELHGLFYRRELQAASHLDKSKSFRIRKILGYKGRGSRKLAKVLFIGWPEPEWIPASNVKRIAK